MRRTISAAAAICASLLSAAVPAVAGDVLLRGGDLYTVGGGILRQTDLLIEGGRIAKIGRGIEAGAGVEVVDVTGRRVYPGLIALQTTLGLIEIDAVRATNDKAEVGDVTPEVAAHVAYTPDSEILPTVRSHGITTAQVVPEGGLVRGRPFVTHLDGWTKEDAGVRLVDGLQVAWPALAVRRGWRQEEKPEEQRKKIDERRRTLREAFDDAAAYARVRATEPATEIDLRRESMLPVVRGEQPVYLVANDYRQIVEAIAFTREHGLRMVLVGAREAHLALDLLAAERVPVIVGSTTALPLRVDDAYDLPYALPRMLHEKGIPFCIAHTAGDGWDVRNLPFQAGQAAAFGLPPDVALRAITLSAAEILGIDDRQGSLEVGKDATLFVSEGDVLDALGQRVTHMWIEGRPVDLDDRHKRLYRKFRDRPAPARR